MSQRPVKRAAELASMIVAELREHPECESAAVVIIGPTGAGWDAALAGSGDNKRRVPREIGRNNQQASPAIRFS
jgi:hypothetical protein